MLKDHKSEIYQHISRYQKYISSIKKYKNYLLSNIVKDQKNEKKQKEIQFKLQKNNQKSIINDKSPKLTSPSMIVCKIDDSPKRSKMRSMRLKKQDYITNPNDLYLLNINYSIIEVFLSNLGKQYSNNFREVSTKMIKSNYEDLHLGFKRFIRTKNIREQYKCFQKNDLDLIKLDIKFVESHQILPYSTHKHMFSFPLEYSIQIARPKIFIKKYKLISEIEAKIKQNMIIRLVRSLQLKHLKMIEKVIFNILSFFIS